MHCGMYTISSLVLNCEVESRFFIWNISFFPNVSLWIHVFFLITNKVLQESLNVCLICVWSVISLCWLWRLLLYQKNMYSSQGEIWKKNNSCIRGRSIDWGGKKEVPARSATRHNGFRIAMRTGFWDKMSFFFYFFALQKDTYTTPTTNKQI